MIKNRFYFNCFFAVLIGLTFSACVSTKVKSKKQSFTFIQLSDPQFGFLSKEPGGLEKEIRRYEKAVATVNEMKPDFLVITGDFVNEPRDSNQLAIFKRITKKVNATIPVYYAPGNHDVGNKPTSADIAFYKKHYGDDKFSFHHKGFYFIGINSSLIKGESTALEDKQLAWLTKELKKGKKYNTSIVFTHHPIFLFEPLEADDAYFNLPKTTRLKYLKLLEEHNVKAIFAGHYHRNAYGKYNDMEMVTTNAVGNPFKGPSGFQVIEVKNNVISHRYHSLE